MNFPSDDYCTDMIDLRILLARPLDVPERQLTIEEQADFYNRLTSERMQYLNSPRLRLRWALTSKGRLLPNVRR